MAFAATLCQFWKIRGKLDYDRFGTHAGVGLNTQNGSEYRHNHCLLPNSDFAFCFAGDYKICLGTKSFHGTKNPLLAASKHFGEPCSFAGAGG
jgi:hypothetical protein